MEQYSVSREALKTLFVSHLKLAALESGGVDNWSWYGASINDYIRDWAIETKRDPDEDWSIEDIAEEELNSL